MILSANANMVALIFRLLKKVKTFIRMESASYISWTANIVALPVPRELLAMGN
jgi:hypothetical protein